MKNLGFFKKYSFFLAILTTSFFFLENCQTIKKSSELNFSQFIENSVFFQKSKLNSSQEFTFDKNSTKLKYLTILQSGQGSIARFVEISIYSYKEDFYRKVREDFPRSEFQKYKIIETVRAGKAILQENERMVQVQFQTEESRQAGGEDIVESIDKLIAQSYKKSATTNQMTTFSLREDGNLWKKEEFSQNGKSKFSWRNHEEGGIIKKFAYTEFKENDTEKRISRITDDKEFIFKKIDLQDANKPYKLFQNSEYAIYYFPDATYKLEHSNIVAMENPKRQLTLYKNKFPILVYKKEFPIK